MSLSKITALAERSQQFHERLGQELDVAMARYDDLDKRKADALAKHHAYLDLAESNLETAEKAVTLLTNIPLGNSA